jgi:uncharacterized integral membrane protein
MNAKLLFKTIFLMAIVLLLVMIGMHNRGTVTFSLPPILPKSVSAPAAIMFICFFAAGVITGTILTAGRGSKSSGGGGASKPSKPSKG